MMISASSLTFTLCPAGQKNRALVFTVSVFPRGAVVVFLSLHTGAGGGHWHKFPSRPTKRGVVSTPAARLKNSPLILPRPDASPKSVLWRITAPGICILASMFSFATFIILVLIMCFRDSIENCFIPLKQIIMYWFLLAYLFGNYHILE